MCSLRVVQVADNQNSLTVGPAGPILLQDSHLIDKVSVALLLSTSRTPGVLICPFARYQLAHFDRERIPERVVHAKGAGAHGYFEVTADVTKYTKAK